MITQRIFDYEFFKKEKIHNFYINDTNTDAFHGVTINPNKYIYLKGLLSLFT